MKTFDEVYHEFLFGDTKTLCKDALLELLLDRTYKRDELSKLLINEKYSRSSFVLHKEKSIRPPTRGICKKFLSKPEGLLLSGIVSFQDYHRWIVDSMLVTDLSTKFSVTLEVSFKTKVSTFFYNTTKRYVHDKELRLDFDSRITGDEGDILSEVFNYQEQQLIALTLYELFKLKQKQEEETLEIEAKLEHERRMSQKESIRDKLTSQYKEYE